MEYKRTAAKSTWETMQLERTLLGINLQRAARPDPRLSTTQDTAITLHAIEMYYEPEGLM
jgi:hypothetical protein